MTQPLMLYKVLLYDTDSYNLFKDGDISFGFDDAKQTALEQYGIKITAPGLHGAVAELGTVNCLIIQEYQHQSNGRYKLVSEWSCREDDAMRWEWSAV